MLGIFKALSVEQLFRGKDEDMKVNKRVLQAVALVMGVCMLCFVAQPKEPQIVQIEEEPCALGDSAGVLVEYIADDLTVIPDKYNTGAKGNLTVVEIGGFVNGIQFKAGSENTRNVLDFAYRNKEISGTITFENYDFSQYSLWSYNEDKVERQIKIIFNNCKFSTVAVGKEAGNLSFEFNNCTLEGFNGSNTIFNSCHFTKGNTDGLVPFQNIEVNNCFFSDMACKAASGKEIHTDGTQIYGIAGIDVSNVSYSNCRFEIPPLSVEGSTASINACIMLQLEYSNAVNVSFTDCIVNGGGYSIYAWDKNKGYTFENVYFDGIRSGCAKSFGTMYGNVAPSIKINDISETDALYVSSVWKENDETYFIVSNDTNQERKLVIKTDAGSYEHVIPACPKGDAMTADMIYEDMPFDMKIIVPENCNYAICYDATVDGYAKQIRYINWSGQEVYLDKNIVEEMTSKGEDVVVSGMCGSDVEFKLTKAGVLILSGTGATENYHSAKSPLWIDYVDSIQEVRIEEGIDTLGTQLFRNCSAIKTVTLPESLLAIEKRAFAGCTSLTAVKLPGNIVKLGDAVFAGSNLQKVEYAGDDWNAVSLGTGNENLVDKLIVEQVVETDDTGNIIMQGMCGDGVEYILTEDGVLRLFGSGATYNYHSANVAPWNEVKDSVKFVVVEEGIEKLGEQLFAKCTCIESIQLPQSLKVIGKNAFISCTGIKEITLPKGVTEICNSAFAGTTTIHTYYEGTVEEWALISIGTSNESILEDLTCQ